MSVTKSPVKDWTIGICNTASDGVVLYKYRGTEQQAKDKLLSLIVQDHRADADGWDHGTEFADEIEGLPGGDEFYGYGSYDCYHIDYTLRRTGSIEEVA